MANAATRTPLPLPLRPLESVWFGVTLLTLLLVYLSVGSALPMVRESRLFEMTEFEWFNWWPFALLGALLCANLTVVTLRRIPFNLIKLGVWMIHSGIVLLVLTSWWYFANKVEGDAAVIRRLVEVRTPAGDVARFPALPGAHADAGGYSFTVANLDPAWPILTGEHEGEEAFSVSVMVTPPAGVNGGEPFIRQLLAGYPQYTEDILPGRGRAVKNTGEKLVDAPLAMSLAPAAQNWFHLAQTRAIYVREVGADDWTQIPISGLPRFNDYAGDPGRDLWLAPGDPIPNAAPLDREIKGFPAPARITGFVRYASAQRRVVQSSTPGSPAAILAISGPGGSPRAIQLAVGIDPFERTSGGALAIVAVESDDETQDLLESARPAVRVSVGDTVHDEVVRETLADNPALPLTPLADTGFSYRVRLVADGLRMPDGTELSSAILEIESPEGERFVRIVSDDASVAQDVDTEENGAGVRPLDARLSIAYAPGQTPASITLVVGPDHARDAALLFASTGNAPAIVPLAKGETVALPAGGSAELLELFASAEAQTRPAIVPRRQRDRGAGDYYSMAQVEIAGERRWLPFHEYVFDGPEYRYEGRLRYEPEVFTLPDGRDIEVLFARERRALPAPVALDDFILKSHVGGFTGATPTIRDWISHVRFQTEEGPSDIVEIRTNHPASFAGLSFFQARWDPPSEAGGGFAFTGLGVGSRSGVTAMLASSCLSVAGMIYVFYIKPAIQRRRVQRALAAKAATRPEPDEPLAVVTTTRRDELEEVNA